MIALSYNGNAQLTEPFQQQSSEKQLADGSPVDPCTDPFEYCPIDDGLYALLAIGVGYGIIRYKQSKKASSLSGEN